MPKWWATQAGRPKPFPDVDWDLILRLTNGELRQLSIYAAFSVAVVMARPGVDRKLESLLHLARQVQTESQAIGFLKFLGYDTSDLENPQLVPPGPAVSSRPSSTDAAMGSGIDSRGGGRRGAARRRR